MKQAVPYWFPPLLLTGLMITQASLAAPAQAWQPATVATDSLIQTETNAIAGPDGSPQLVPAPVLQDELARESGWVDRKRSRIREQLDMRAQRLDRWFGDGAQGDARAGLRLLLDTTWNEYDGADTSVRVRGSLRLPNATRTLRLVFGDDTLDNESRAIYGPNTPATPRIATAGTPSPTDPATLQPQTRRERLWRDNNSVALRWLRNPLPGYDTDLDLGLRGTADVYVRGRIGKSWQHSDQVRSSLLQMVRYGSKSELYAQTDYDLTRQRPDRPAQTYNATLIYNQREDEYGPYWVQRVGQYQTFQPQQTFSYGLMAAGWLGNDYLLNQYGPWVSYRQPFLRDWFFIRGDLAYVNDRSLQRDHTPVTFIRLEALF